MAMAPIIVASRVTPAVSNRSMESPSSSKPSSAVGSLPPPAGRSGNSATRPTRASPAKATIPATFAVRCWWTMVMGLSPAGFIMNMTMKTAMMVISPAIMSTRTRPRKRAFSSTITAPTAANDASSQ